MEIITYFDSKSSFIIPTEGSTLEDMLNTRLPSRKRLVIAKKTKHKNASIENEKQHNIYFLETLCTTIKKLRYVLISVCVALVTVLCAISAMLYFQSYAQTVNFNQAVLMEEEILANAMHDFVAMSASAEVDEAEALALIASGDVNALYSQPVSFTNYTVQSGDSIHTISNKFGLDNISTLIGINNIDNVRLLWAGQNIRIPSVDGLMYSVKKGDSLEAIAQNYSISIEEILDVNELESSVIHVGDTLFIPGAQLDSTSLRQAMGELFKFPLSSRNWRISSNYGYRADPFTGVRSFHTGTDFAIAKGTPVRAAMSGTVSVSGYSSIYGYYVIVNHGNGYQTLYAHFMEEASVRKGQTVNQNTVIGYVGSTGYSTGNHLHFSVYKDGKLVNPRTVINF